MALTFHEAKSGLNDVAEDLTNILTGMRQVQLQADRQKQLADGLPAKYGTLAAGINTQAAANPADAVWQDIKAQKDKLAGEFATLSTLADSLKTAADSVDLS